MDVSFPYKDSQIHLHIDESVETRVLLPKTPETTSNSKDQLLRLLESDTFDGKSFTHALESIKRLLVIVNDGTRPTPTAQVLEVVCDDFDKKEVNFLVATGAHRYSSEIELKRIFGHVYEQCKDRIIIHDARKDEDLCYVGTTSYKTEVFFHHLVKDSDGILVIGSVEPHYFAGFTGGRKGLLPGVSGFNTIEQNHHLALSEQAYAMNLENNPVHLDMQESLEFINDKQLFGIMAVLDGNHDVDLWTGGSLKESFIEASTHAHEVFGVPIDKKADIVITVARYPSDINLYQSQKALDNAKLAVAEGGVILFVSPCTEGLGDEEFANLLSVSTSLKGVLDYISQTYVLGYHKAAKMAQIFESVTVYAYTELEDEKIASLFMHPVHNLQMVLDKVIKTITHPPVVYIMPDGGMTIPTLLGNLTPK